MKEPALFKNIDFPVTPAEAFHFSTLHGEEKSAFQEWVSLEPTAQTSATVDLLAAPESKLQYAFFQDLDMECDARSKIRVEAQKGAKVELTVVIQGAKQSQLAIETHCSGSGSEIKIEILQNAKQDQKFEVGVSSHHAVPHTRSELTVSCVARDSATCIFNGLITIEKNAHHTEAYQKNKNLILSDRATIDSFPKLLIGNDEVKCAHGSSTGSLDPDQLIYLRSRGMDLAEAEVLLTQGFMNQRLLGLADLTALARIRAALGLEREET